MKVKGRKPSFLVSMMIKQKKKKKRDEYGDLVDGPKITKKEKEKNLKKNTPDEQHTTTTSEAVNPAQQAAIAIAKREKKERDMVAKKMRKEDVKMSRKAYNKLHKDFKSDDPKNPRTTKYVPGKGTVSMPVTFTDEYVPEGKEKLVYGDFGNYTKNQKVDKKKEKKLKEPPYEALASDYAPDMSMVEDMSGMSQKSGDKRSTESGAGM
ncbi:MAG: hypothetical protein VXY93_17300, partial [Pseudomonadota bacterium]|nr:hypothetical protein [Pseudomonadota bacterium]